jgi:hypothetical protein
MIYQPLCDLGGCADLAVNTPVRYVLAKIMQCPAGNAVDAENEPFGKISRVFVVSLHNGRR